MTAAARAGLIVLCLLGFFGLAKLAERLWAPGSPQAWALGRMFCRVLLALLRIRVVVSGEPAAGLVVANHVSWIDPVVFGHVAPFSALAKREIAGWPVIGTFARLQDTLLIDRASRIQVRRVNIAMATRLARGGRVLLFAEGTTHSGAARGPFRTAHFGCLRDHMAFADLDRSTVQAAAIAFSDPAAAWVGEATLLPHVWSILTRPALTCTLSFGAATAVPQGYDRKALARATAAAVETLLAHPPVRVAEAAPHPAISRDGLGRAGC